MARMREETLRGRELKDEGQVEDTQERDLENPPGEDTLDSNDMSPLEKVMTLEAELIQAKAKADEHYNHALRLQAEFDNYRKRTQKEKAEIIKHASERLVAELLPVLDNFERAASSAQSNPDINAFAQGVDMIFRQLQTVLNKEGLTAIEALGQPFDPNLHDAVLRVESDEHPENTVVEELQKGYYLKEKVLRPSMVKVSN
ncbi:nucleotide exchange factor GrpE [Desulfosporosinus youngiae]|uniref:Protein GrpE n=1 Tax=Desulfosporosinus youngiae DSM 17734 TaxID=768710 RepID=H5XZ16_9FIRM|nr:nucleotide exchange factor GrpE [Desulfosporosinus youngiae]EHQ91722.1 molecular chaperone GrpE (heat shock protein) [Desulfosporosinus youngiae DSM 17734]